MHAVFVIWGVEVVEIAARHLLARGEILTWELISDLSVVEHLALVEPVNI